jgi:hypothetical protein
MKTQFNPLKEVVIMNDKQKQWEAVVESAHSDTDGVVPQRIRYWAEKENLTAKRRKGLWYLPRRTTA